SPVAPRRLWLAPLPVERNRVALRPRGQRLLAARVLATGPRRARAGLERPVGIRHHALGIDFEAGADAAALRARAIGIVEREHARRHFGEGDAAVGAGEALGEDHGLQAWEIVRPP